MGQGLSAIRQRHLKIGQLHEAAVLRQGWQGMPVPIDPAGQIIVDGKSRAQSVLQHLSRCQGKFPAFFHASPGATWTHPADLGMGDSVERVHHLHQAGRRQAEIATGAWRRRSSTTSKGNFRGRRNVDKQSRFFVTHRQNQLAKVQLSTH